MWYLIVLFLGASVDQEFALQWVQTYVRAFPPCASTGSLTHFLSQISKFGGDPTKVTIWGESAGKHGRKDSSHYLTHP